MDETQNGGKQAPPEPNEDVRATARQASSPKRSFSPYWLILIAVLALVAWIVAPIIESMNAQKVDTGGEIRSGAGEENIATNPQGLPEGLPQGLPGTAQPPDDFLERPYRYRRGRYRDDDIPASPDRPVMRPLPSPPDRPEPPRRQSPRRDSGPTDFSAILNSSDEAATSAEIDGRRLLLSETIRLTDRKCRTVEIMEDGQKIEASTWCVDQGQRQWRMQ